MGEENSKTEVRAMLAILRVATIFDGLALAMIDGEVGLEGES